MKPLYSSDSVPFAETWAPSSTFSASSEGDHGYRPIDQATGLHLTIHEPAATCVSSPPPNRAQGCCSCRTHTKLLLAGLALIIAIACAALAVGVYFAVTKDRGVL